MSRVSDASDILDTAQHLLNGDRAAAYGDAVDNHARIARMFGEVTGHQLTARDVALLMVCVKLSRLRVTPDHEDSFVDAAAYMSIAGASARRVRDPKSSAT